jgi:hypothetical protein
MGHSSVLPATVLLLVLAPAGGAAQSDSCTHKVWTWKVDKTSARELQHHVNEGHEPWRRDNLVDVAEGAISDRKKEWSDENTIVDVPKVVSQTKDHALIVATSEDGGTRYKATLRKYSWLLKTAHDDWRWVIWLPASVERIGCPTQ